LYSKFLRSANFKGWLKLKEREAHIKLRQVYLETCLRADILPLLRDKTEIEIIDLYLRLHELVRAVFHEPNPNEMHQFKTESTSEARLQLEAQLAKVVQCLPKDLAASILQSNQCVRISCKLTKLMRGLGAGQARLRRGILIENVYSDNTNPNIYSSFIPAFGCCIEEAAGKVVDEVVKVCNERGQVCLVCKCAEKLGALFHRKVGLCSFNEGRKVLKG
jgi:hypothetical protein